MGKTDLEKQILASAEELFLAKGFAATSTTDIARHAGCNQALVHYYYRTKEKLFQQIFMQKIEMILTMISEPLRSETDFFDKLRHCINLYFDTLNNNRQIPFLIMNELIINRERREFIRQNLILNHQRQAIYYNLCDSVKTEIAKGTIRDIDPFDLLLNIISLTVSTFVFLPIYTDLLEKDSEAQMKFIEHRKEEIFRVIYLSLKP